MIFSFCMVNTIRKNNSFTISWNSMLEIGLEQTGFLLFLLKGRYKSY